MPIHKSFFKMAKGIVNRSDYCKRDPTKVSYKFTDGTTLSGCKGGWSVFYATLKKRGWSDTKPMPKKASEAIIKWFLGEADSSDPTWVALALKALKSPKTPAQLKEKLRKKLATYYKKTGKKPPYPLLKGSKIKSGGKGKGLGRGKGKGPMGKPVSEALVEWFLQLRKKPAGETNPNLSPRNEEQTEWLIDKMNEYYEGKSAERELRAQKNRDFVESMIRVILRE